tara:strand:+ start:459 stop:1451 length:993 start_codon:yes stop_codon:yes gene_type:complete
MKRIIVGITDHSPPPFNVEKEALGHNAEIIFLNSIYEENFDPKILRKLDALLVWRTKISENTIRFLDRCKIVVRYGVGYDDIDLKTLNKNGIHFCNVPDYGTQEVADSACALLLGLHRRILYYDNLSRKLDKDWQNHSCKTSRFSKTTLGVVGVGRIGTALINRMKPFGVNIIGFDPFQPSGHEKAIGYDRVSSIYHMLSKCDLISFHCPLNEDTIGIINMSLLSKLKSDSIVVNTARGNILESLDVLEEALYEKIIWGAGLDVLPEEPPSDHSLIRAWRGRESWLQGRLIINPHQAFFSNHSWFEMRFKAAETVRLFFTNGTIRNKITE